jgi:hypothetical protein
VTRQQANQRRGQIAAVLIALGLHVAALTALGLSRGKVVFTQPVAERIPLQLRLVQLADLGAPTARSAAGSPGTANPAARHAAPDKPTRAAAKSAPSSTISPRPAAPAPASNTPVEQDVAAAPGMMGPPTAAASAAAAVASGVRAGLRESVGCDDEKYLKMPSSEREKCNQRFGRLAKDAPHVRALDLEQKAYFDGDCDPPDDEWCLYRRGKGPYPGLLSLYRKYHPHNDH